MSTTQDPVIFRHIRRLASVQGLSRQSDSQLLQQFTADRDEAAFAQLVQRHGTIVLGVCRSVLHHQQDAEDVFQAALLVLARRAHTIRKQESLGSWLHGVAYRLALKARARASRRRDREPPAPQRSSASALDDLTMRELRVVLHEEVHRLTEKYRAALLLCYWEGKTRDEAAEQLGMSSGSFKKCLERARNLLGSRLTRRGLVPSSALFATLFASNGAQAALPSVLVKTTAQAAVAFAAGKTAGVSAATLALAERVIYTMNLTKWVTTFVAIVLLGGLGTGVGVTAFHFMQEAAADAQNQDFSLQDAQAPQGTAQNDQERIVGTWRFGKGIVNGEELSVAFTELGRLKFTKDDNLIMTLGDETKKGTYDIVGRGKLNLEMGVNGKELNPAIYKFDGNDSLTICGSVDGQRRPTEYKADKGSPHYLFILVRAKPGDEKPSSEDVARLKGSVDKLRETAARTMSSNNLKQIALAMHNWDSTYGALPSHAIYSKDGKTPLLSWRVAILPFIEQLNLYKRFKIDEPWDSAHNKELISEMPRIYQLPNAPKTKKGETYYQVVTGPHTVFDGAKKMKLTAIKGLSNTLLVVEAKTPVVWSKPDDLELPKDKNSQLPVGGVFTDGFNVLMADGSVRFLSQTVPAAKLRSMITPAGKD